MWCGAHAQRGKNQLEADTRRGVQSSSGRRSEQTYLELGRQLNERIAWNWGTDADQCRMQSIYSTPTPKRWQPQN